MRMVPRFLLPDPLLQAQLFIFGPYQFAGVHSFSAVTRWKWMTHHYVDHDLIWRVRCAKRGSSSSSPSSSEPTDV